MLWISNFCACILNIFIFAPAKKLRELLSNLGEPTQIIMIMKKIFLLFLFIPLFSFSQNNLVKWFNGNFSASVVEQHITSSAILKAGDVSLTDANEGFAKLFYTSGNWAKPNYNGPSVLDSSKYLQYTISADQNYQIKLDAFKFNARAGGSPSFFQVRYSKNADFSSYSVLQAEADVPTVFTDFNLQFPSNTVVNSGETFYIRIYVYKTENNFQLLHNLSGSISQSLTGVVSLVTPVKPVANDDRTGTSKNKSVAIDVLENDDYRFSGPITAITILGNPANGTAVKNGVTGITYTPNSNFLGYDRFYYTLTNSAGVSNTAKVEVQVIDGVDKVLVRWNKPDQSPTNYDTIVTGTTFKVVGENIEINSNEVMSSGGKSFMLSNLPNPQQFDGKEDPSKYVSFSIASKNADSFAALKAFKLSYRGRGDGNLTVLASKNADFSGEVFTIANDVAYNSSWMVKDFVLPSGVYLFPEETLYFRLYAYNTYNTFLIDFVPNGESGPAVTGISIVYAPEPCSTTVTWDGTKWSGTPNINKKAILNAGYSTSTNGSFEACNLTVNSGKLTISADYPVKIQNELNVTAAANVEIENNANFVQVNDATTANSGNITLLRDIKIGAARTQYNYLGSPVTFVAGQNLKTIYPGITFTLYHNESTNFFSNSSGANIPGRGLAVKEPTTTGVPSGTGKVTAKFIGVPQNGIIPFPLANSNTGTTTNLGYNLLGNPYPSNIDLKLLYELNAGSKADKNISATFYLWDNQVNNDIALAQQGSEYKAQAYAVFNVLAGKNGMGTAALGYSDVPYAGKKTPTQIIGAGQGFMTKALAKNYTLIFNNSIRTGSDQAVNFFGKTLDQNEEDDRFWLKMVSPANLTSNLGVVYFAEGSNSVGPEDTSTSGASDDLYSMTGDQKLSINGRASFNPSDVLSLGSQHFTTGNYTIAVDKTEGIFSGGQNIYLKDNQTGILINLSQGAYEFTATQGESSGRFEISYVPAIVLATEAANREEIGVYKDGGDIILKSTSKKMTSIEVYDMSGRLIVALQPNNKQAVIHSSSLKNGVFIVKINQGASVTTKKIIQ